MLKLSKRISTATLLAICICAAIYIAWIYLGGPERRPFKTINVMGNADVEAKVFSSMETYAVSHGQRIREEVFDQPSLGRHYLIYATGRDLYIVAENTIEDGKAEPASHYGAENPHFAQDKVTVFFYAGKLPWSRPNQAAPSDLETLLRSKGLVTNSDN